VTVGGYATDATLTGLDNGTRYRFTVRAINALGVGSASDRSNAVTPAARPDAPKRVAAKAGNHSAKVRWRPPAANGSAITGYRVIASSGGGGARVGADATTARVTGLRNGKSYTFTVKAINGVGTGPSSKPSNAVTPRRARG